MRRLILPFLFLFLLSLCSCKEAAPNITPLVRQIKFTAQTVWEDTAYCFTVSTDSELNATFTVEAPEALKELQLIFSPETVQTQYFGIENEIPLSGFSENSPFATVYHLLLYANQPENELCTEKDYIFTECEIAGNKYCLYFTETGLPLKAESPDTKTTILFKSISVLN